MASKPFYPSILIGLFITGLLTGCTVTHKVTRRSELMNPLITGPITVLMKNKTQYKLETYFLRDTVLLGRGIEATVSGKRPFDGELKLSEIGYVQSNETSFLKGLMTTTLVGVFVVTAASSFDGTEGLSVTPKVAYHGPGGGGSSCPTIYSWNGKNYILEAEAFGVALGKGLELETWSVLPSLVADSSQLKIRISNERPETHHVNSVRLHAAEADTNATVYLDANDQLWPSYEASVPVSAFDHSGTNILEAVRYRDSLSWESDLAGASIISDFADVVDLSFVNTGHTAEGSLIVSAINTHFSEEVFQQVFTFLGDQSLAFMDAVEHDPEVIHTLKNWIKESSLKAYILTRSGWEPIGSIQPEANAVPFSRLLRFKTSQSAQDTVRIRLVSLADVWKIDAVQVDWTPVKPLVTVQIPVSFAENSCRDVRPQLLSADNQYVVLLPSDKIELAFEAPEFSSGKKAVYALGVQGFLYEGIPEALGEQSRYLTVALPSEARVAFVKHLIQQKSLLLPPIYTAWKARKEKNLETRLMNTQGR